MRHDVYLGLGSNLGDRAAYLVFALGRLARLGGLCAISSLYRTAPQGGPVQPDYFNLVACLTTDYEPHALLGETQTIERAAGRERRERFGPRTLDIDILLWGSLELTDAALAIPHPRLAERRFVLEPLCEVAPDLRMPDGTRMATLLDRVRHQRVERIAGSQEDLWSAIGFMSD